MLKKGKEKKSLKIRQHHLLISHHLKLNLYT